jgi:hypothetical protein
LSVFAISDAFMAENRAERQASFCVGDTLA